MKNSMTVSFDVLLKDLAFFGIVSTGALCVGFLSNQFRDDPLGLIYQSKGERIMSVVTRQKRENPVLPIVDSEFSEYIGIDQVKKYVEDRDCLILDARPEVFHRIGHIPGALSLPREDFETAYSGLKATLEKDRHQKIVLYCSSTSCQDSDLVRMALVSLGYDHVAILKGGWAAWKAEGGKSEEQQ